MANQSPLPLMAFKLSLEELTACLALQNLSRCNATITRSPIALPLLWDSRDLESMPNQGSEYVPEFVFFGQKGLSFDGHSACKKVISKGGLFVGESKKVLEGGFANSEWVQTNIQKGLFLDVKDDKQALSISLLKASDFNPKDFNCIAVTGTNGKTSITQILGELSEASSKQQNLRIGTLGVQLGRLCYVASTPTMPPFSEFLSCISLAVKNKTKNIYFEATSQGLHQNRLGNWKVNTAIFSNLTQDHLDYHKNMTQYLEAKCLLFTEHLNFNGVAVINCESSVWSEVLSKSSANKKELCFVGVGTPKNQAAFCSKASDLKLNYRYLTRTNETTNIEGVHGELGWHGSNQTHLYSSTLIGNFQHENLTLAIAALASKHDSLGLYCSLASAVTGIRGRLERAEATTNQPLVLIDYAHSPDSLKQTLATGRTLTKGKLIAVFGCGGDRDKSKRPVMGKIASELADFCIVTSDNPRTEVPETIIHDIVQGVSTQCLSKIQVEPDRKIAIVEGILLAKKGDVVIIMGKGHEDYQIIGDQILHFDDKSEAELTLQNQLQQRWKD